jgi:hypothetical protein
MCYATVVVVIVYGEVEDVTGRAMLFLNSDDASEDREKCTQRDARSGWEEG